MKSLDIVPDLAEPPSEDHGTPSAFTDPLSGRQQIEAEYALEHAVRCPACGETVTQLKAVRLLRTRVNFTSTLPRRGRVLVCARCFVIVPAELSNF